MSDLSTNRMRDVITRLFNEAPKLEDASGKPRTDQAPALECQIVLKSGMQFSGAISTTPEGTLRMLSPNQQMDQRTRTPIGPPVMVESFFDYEQISLISLMRPMTISAEQPTAPIIHTA